MKPPPPVAVLDIDGVVADVRHRLHHLSVSPANWPAFWRDAGRDPLLADGAAHARDLAGSYGIKWVTGRPERLRAMTSRWLTDHHLPAGELVMHPGNYEELPTREFKHLAINDLARDHEVVVILDDDPVVVRLLHAGGFNVKLADWCPYSPTVARQSVDMSTPD